MNNAQIQEKVLKYSNLQNLEQMQKATKIEKDIIEKTLFVLTLKGKINPLRSILLIENENLLKMIKKGKTKGLKKPIQQNDTSIERISL